MLRAEAPGTGRGVLGHRHGAHLSLLPVGAPCSRQLRGPSAPLTLFPLRGAAQVSGSIRALDRPLPSSSVLGPLGSGSLGVGGTVLGHVWPGSGLLAPSQPRQSRPAEALAPPGCLRPPRHLGPFPGMGIPRILGSRHLCPGVPPGWDCSSGPSSLPILPARSSLTLDLGLCLFIHTSIRLFIHSFIHHSLSALSGHTAHEAEQ